MKSPINRIKSIWSDPYLRLLSLIVFCGAVVRLWGIGWGLPYRIGGDPGEFVAASLRLIANPSSYLESIVGGRIYPPVYHYFLTPFFVAFLVLIFAKHFFVTLSFGKTISFLPVLVYKDLWVFTLIARIVTALLGTATIFLVYILACKVSKNKKVGLVTAAIYCFLFGDVYFAHFNVTHIPLTFLVVAACITFIKLTEYPAYKNYVFSALLCTMVIATKFTYWPIFIIFLIVHYFYTPGQRKLVNGKLFLFMGACTVTMMVLVPPVWYSPKHFLNQIVEYSVLFKEGQVGPTNFFGAYIFDNRPKFNGLMLTNSFWGGMGILPFSLSICGLFYSFIKRDKATLLAIFALIMYLYMESYPLKGIKYLVPIFPLLTILGAKFLVEITDKIKINNRIFLAILGFILLLPALKVMQFDDMISGTHTWVAAKPWIENNIAEDTSVFATTFAPPLELNRHSFNWLSANMPSHVDVFKEHFEQSKVPQYDYTQIDPKHIEQCLMIEQNQIGFISPWTGEKIYPSVFILDGYTKRKVQYEDVREWNPQICDKWDEFIAYVNSNFELIKSFQNGQDDLFGPDVFIYKIPRDLLLIKATEANSRASH